MNRSLIRVVDLETTGFPPDAEIVEIGAVDVFCAPMALPAVDPMPPHCGRSIFVRPSRTIPCTASAIHHIVDEDVAHAADWASTWPLFVSSAVDIWCAHSAKFERAFLTDEMTAGKPWICTWKCALRMWPEAPSHSNQALRYWLKPAGIDRSLAAIAHRAWPDAYVTAHLLAAMIERSSIEQLIAWSADPALLPRIPFGSLKGQPWPEADDGFLEWVLRRDFDEDVMFTARAEVKRRASIEPAASEVEA